MVFDETGEIPKTIDAPAGLFPIRCVDWDREKHRLARMVANNQFIAGQYESGAAVVLDELEKVFPEKYESLMLKELGEAVGIDNKLAMGEIEKPEVEFTEELLESHNYVVLYFDNDVDWLQAKTLFDLKTVKALDSKKGYEKQGVGRVLNGADAIKRLTGGGP